MKPVLFVHAGAGDDYDDRVEAFREGVKASARLGWSVLQNGGKAIDAVETAVIALEDDPILDAGIGSFINRNNEVEMDAMVMEGRELGYGAVACIQRVKNPVRVARLVLERSRHSLFVGAGAEAFARSVGIDEFPMEELVKHSSTHLLAEEHRGLSDESHDTVGAIALDSSGNLAVACSTGGTAGKMPGRVGDSPIIGCGGYADNVLGAAAASGIGENLMKIIFCKSACDLLKSGYHPQDAAEKIVNYLKERTGSTGGIILVGPDGEIGSAYSTHLMVRAWISEADGLHVLD